MSKAELVDELVTLTGKPARYYTDASVSTLREKLRQERARIEAQTPALTARPTVAAATTNNGGGMDALGSMLAAIIEPKLSLKADMDEVMRVIDERMASILAPTIVEIHKPGEPPVIVGLAHRLITKLLRLVERGRNVFLHGAPGGGKTTVAKQVADALGLSFHFLAFSSQTTAVKLTGFIDAHGQPVSTVVRAACNEPSVLLLDEVDKASPAVLAEVHGLMSQRVLSCPDGAVDAHPDMRIIAAANTPGLGGKTGHETAQRLDVAFRSRFVFLEWEYDVALEMAVATSINPHSRPWVEWVHGARKFIASKPAGTVHIVADPRTVFDGAELWNDSDMFTVGEIADMCFFKACDPQHRTLVLENCPLPAVV